jgi:hypothetical protein
MPVKYLIYIVLFSINEADCQQHVRFAGGLYSRLSKWPPDMPRVRQNGVKQVELRRIKVTVGKKA